MKTWPYVGLCLLVFARPGTCRAVGDEFVTAVSARASKDYERKRLPDGSFLPEEFCFGNGGHYQGSFGDATIDALTFQDIARMIAPPLASQKYIESKDADKIRFLVMVYWGTTSVPQVDGTSNGYTLYQNATTAQAVPQIGQNTAKSPNSSQTDEALALIDLENRQRDHLDYTNARMLGYDSLGVIGTEYGAAMKHSAMKLRQQDLVAEIEHNRYFVVLMAYDFQLLSKQKKHKLVWETRFSINQPHNDFGKALPMMAQNASRYFGQDSNGLVRQKVRDGHVEVGDPTLINFFSSPRK